MKNSATMFFSLYVIVVALGAIACDADDPRAEKPSLASSPASGQFPTASDAAENKMIITIGSKTFTATLEDNPATTRFRQMLPLTLDMSDLNANEKHARLPDRLPTDLFKPGTIRSGDLLLWGDDTLVLFYETFRSAYSYTRLGRIDDPSGLAAAVGAGDVSVTFDHRAVGEAKPAPAATSTVNIGAILRPKAGKSQALRQALLSMVRPTRHEAGCITYDLYEKDDGSLILHEVWRSQADLDNHFRQPYLQDFLKNSPEFLESNDAYFGSSIGSIDNRAEHANTGKTAAITILSVKVPKSGKAEELRAALLSLVEPTKAEPGCVAYIVHEAKDGSLFLFEQWRSQEDLEQHFQKPYIKDFRSKADDLLAKNEIHFGKLLPTPSN